MSDSGNDLVAESFADRNDGLRVTQTDSATCILLTGCLGLDAVDQLDDVLRSLPDESSEAPVLLRISSTEVEFGASDALGALLMPRSRLGSRPFAVWADEPLIRRAIPLARLHASPPTSSHSWDAEIPLS
jgi:hypothetical protein